MLFFSRNSFTFVYGGVNGATAVQELEVLFGDLLADIMTEIAVWNKQYVFRVHIFNDFNRRGGGHANIAYGFEVCGGVDISNNFVIRVFLFDGADKLFIHLLCHGAACNGLSQNYLFLRREYFNGLGHKSDADHYYCFLRSGCRLDGKRVAVAGKVRYLNYFVRNIAVRQNTYILFLFKPENFLLNVFNHLTHLFQVLCRPTFL